MRLTKLFIAFPIILIVLVLLFIALTQIVPGLEISSYRTLFNTVTGKGIDNPTPQQLKALITAEHFNVTVFAKDIPQARMLKITPSGQLLVSSPNKGTIFLLNDSNHDGLADTTTTLISGLNRPHGIDLFQDYSLQGNINHWLYIAETDAVGRIAMDWDTGKALGQYQRLITNLPSDGGHWTRTIRFGPDGWLYLTIGSSCNVCIETDQRRATMMRFRPDGSKGHIYASGLRNTIGFDWAPWNNELYGTDNGRDLLGDDFPPCELNLIKQNGFYGWPFINGFAVLDPDYGQKKHRQEQDTLLNNSLSPSYGFRAHNAPLGIHFLQHPSHQKYYQRTALVALHGSWNRSSPDGYKVVALQWDAQGNVTSNDFLSNFLQPDGHIIGRPVDIEEGIDGSIYISDDYAGVIYRVVYK